MKSDPTFWLLARATGLTAYVLLTLSVLAGLTVKSKPFGRALKQPTAVDFHRFVALLGITAVVLHSATLALDHAVDIGIEALFVPGLSPYEPVWTGLGVVAAELMVVVYVSFALKKRLGHKNWRRLHWLTYALFAAATAHGVMAGTDTQAPWVFGIYLGAVGSVVAATVWRALAPPAAAARPRPLPEPSPQPKPQAEGAS